MEFYRIDEVPKREGETVFGESRLYNAFFFLIFALPAAGAFAVGVLSLFRGHAFLLPPWAAFLVAAVMALFSLFGLGGLRAAMRPENWLLRHSSEGLTIKFRSFRNAHFPKDDIVAFFLPNTEVSWVRKTREVHVVTRDRSDTREWWTYLDIQLGERRADELESYLRRERNQEAPLVGFSRTKHHHYPVRLLPGGIVRLEWRGPSTWVVPRVETALSVLRYSLPIEREERLGPTQKEKEREEESESRILELVERGDIISAITLVRERYGYDTTRAKEFVEGLSKK